MPANKLNVWVSSPSSDSVIASENLSDSQEGGQTGLKFGTGDYLKSKVFNTILRETSLVTKAIGDFVKDKMSSNIEVTTSGGTTPAQITTALTATINSLISAASGFSGQSVKLTGAVTGTSSYSSNTWTVATTIPNGSISANKLGSIIQTGTSTAAGLTVTLSQDSSTNKLKIGLSGTVTADHTATADNATYANTAATAASATYAATAGSAGTATSADTANTATNATYATTAGSANTAGSAAQFNGHDYNSLFNVDGKAIVALVAEEAYHADTASEAGQATNATNAVNATNATTLNKYQHNFSCEIKRKTSSSSVVAGYVHVQFINADATPITSRDLFEGRLRQAHSPIQFSGLIDIAIQAGNYQALVFDVTENQTPPYFTLKCLTIAYDREEDFQTDVGVYFNTSVTDNYFISSIVKLDSVYQL